MKSFFWGVACWLLMVAGVAAQQKEGVLPPYEFPLVVAQAGDYQDFVPKGWVLLKVVQGDLNGDGRPDLLILLQGDDDRYRYVNEGLGSRNVDANARILVVALANEPGGYTRLLQNNVFVPPHDNPVMDEPFERMGIEKGVIKLTFRSWANAGNWGMAHYSYAFRYQNGEVALIGYEEYYRNRASGNEHIRSANLSTGEQKLTVVDGETGRERVSGKRFAINPLPTLENIEMDGLGLGTRLFGGL